MRVHLAGEHALKFELLDLETQPVDIGLDSLHRAKVGLFGRQFQKLRRIAQSALEAIQTAYDLLELGALPA
ncbi:MAG: hypothetical protein NVS9B2_11350 [Steroidobacteraceae bacterium]